MATATMSVAGDVLPHWALDADVEMVRLMDVKAHRAAGYIRGNVRLMHLGLNILKGECENDYFLIE